MSSNLASARSHFWILLLANGAAAAAAQPPEPARFTAHELTLGGSASRVFAISDGKAVGGATVRGDAEEHAFLWTENRGMLDLGTLGGTLARARAVDGPRVVGVSSTIGDAELHAFIWTPDSGMKDLGTLGGTYGAAMSVSGDVVVGESTTDEGNIHAFRWTRQTGMVDLGTLGGGTESAVTQTDHGLTAGFSSVQGTQTRRPVVWDAAGQLFDVVGTPLDIEDGRVRNEGQATGVRRGVVVGYFRATPPPDLFNHAFMWTVPHGFLDLGVPPAFRESFALATNGKSIVGELSARLETHPFLWTRLEGFIDLGTLNGHSRATAINDRDWVVGTFIRPEGGLGTFLWTRHTGMCDVTPGILPAGAMPVGIDNDGRIAVVDSEEDTARSAVLVPHTR